MTADVMKMNAQPREHRLNFDTPIPYKWAAVISYSMVVLVFVADWFTPDSVVVDIAYEAPVVFAALKGSERLTALTLVLGVTGIVLGWFTDLAQASFSLSDVRIENRLISMLSILLVGALAIVIQRNAHRTIALDGERSRRRAATVSAAIDRVMSALAAGNTLEVLTAEAPQLLEAVAVLWCPVRAGGNHWLAMQGESVARILDVSPAPNIQALVRRVSAQDSVEIVDASETIDVLTGRSAGGKDALAISVGASTSNAGVMFAALRSAPDDKVKMKSAAEFARFASTALRQADLLQTPARPTGSESFEPVDSRGAA
jgi:hypothetical protein